jgi:hypothetical protein
MEVTSALHRERHMQVQCKPLASPCAVKISAPPLMFPRSRFPRSGTQEWLRPTIRRNSHGIPMQTRKARVPTVDVHEVGRGGVAAAALERGLKGTPMS